MTLLVDRLEPLGQRNRLLPSVRLEIADHDVDAGAVQIMRLAQHLVGLSYSGGVAQKDL